MYIFWSRMIGLRVVIFLVFFAQTNKNIGVSHVWILSVGKPETHVIFLGLIHLLGM